MANATPSRPGLIESGSDNTALFLKQFSGEVLTSFHAATVFDSLHMTKTVGSGKSWQFPTHGIASAAYHTPGAEIVGQSIVGNEKVIAVDGLLVSSAFIADWDDLLAHYDVSSIYSKELGQALAQAYDQKVAQNIVLAARQTALVTGQANGTKLTAGSTVATDADVLTEAMWDAAQALDVAKVEDMDRYMALAPAQYYLLIRGATDFLDKDYTSGNGDLAKAYLSTAAGFKLVKTLNLPTTNVTTNDSLENNDYRGDFTDTVAVCFTKQAAATVKRKDIEFQRAEDVRRQGNLLVARMAVGHGWLRPACAVEISKASS